MNKYLVTAALLLTGVATAHSAWADATLDKIRQRGKL